MSFDTEMFPGADCRRPKESVGVRSRRDPIDRSAPTFSLPRDGARDFDFLHGEWRIHNRRLRSPLSGSNEWYEFEAASIESSLWDGQGNLEEYEAVLPTGRLRGLALRLYSPKTHQWSIHW